MIACQREIRVASEMFRGKMDDDVFATTAPTTYQEEN